MNKSLTRILIEFVVLTVPLTWLWVMWAQDAYVALFIRAADPILAWFGIEQLAHSPAEERFVNYVPFLVLMVITPGLSLRRRLGGIGIGFLLIFLCHIGVVAVEHLAHTKHRLTPDPFSTVFPAAMFTDAFPFILWAILANRFVRQMFARVIPSPQGDAPPD